VTGAIGRPLLATGGQLDGPALCGDRIKIEREQRVIVWNGSRTSRAACDQG
jgi:hypothetical protein